MAQCEGQRIDDGQKIGRMETGSRAALPALNGMATIIAIESATPARRRIAGTGTVMCLDT